MTENLISIIIPIYNRASYLDKCIGSALSQENVSTEIILINDGSTDDSGKICDLYAKKYPNIITEHNSNHGVAYSRNRGVALASGEFIFFLDSDDSIEPGILFEMKKALTESGADYCIGKYASFNSDGSLHQIHELCDYVKNRSVDIKTALHTCMDIDYPVIDAIAGKLYYSRLFKNIHFPEDMASEDTYIVPDLLKQCSQIFFLDKLVYKLTLSPVSIMRGGPSPRLIDTCNAHCHLLHYLTENGYYDVAVHRFGMGTRDLLYARKALGKSAKEPLKKSYQNYRRQAKALMPHVNKKTRLRLILFRRSLLIYSYIQKKHSHRMGYQ